MAMAQTMKGAQPVSPVTYITLNRRLPRCQ